MGLQAFFYLFAFVAVASAVMVIAARNPVHSVLFLILTFFNAAGLFMLHGAEFLAMILVVVYVGAVAVLFLFVVMMLDIDFAEMKSGRSICARRRADRHHPGGRTDHRAWPATPCIRAAGSGPADPATERTDQHRGARRRALHRLHLLLPDRRAGAAGGHDRRHRADAAPSRRHQAARHQPSRSRRTPEPPSRWSRSSPARGSERGDVKE
jgi:hypothetical protein